MKPYKSLHYSITYIVATMVSGLFCSPLMAQQGSDDEYQLKLEEVIVTAQKREQSLQDVAISITAITGTDLEKFAIRNFNDIVEMIPGLSTNSPGGFAVGTRVIGIRGIQSQSGAWLVAENTVGFYINNTPISAADPRLVDLERVEVLRGPQGTLYGASSLAGVLKLVTRKPGFDGFTGHVQGEISSIKHGGSGTDFQASMNIPLSSNFAIRASAFYDDQPGYIDGRPVDQSGFVVTGPDEKDFNGLKHKGGRIAAYWEPTENFRAHLSFMLNDTAYETGGFVDQFAPDLSDDGPVTFFRFAAIQAVDDDLTSLEIEWDVASFQIQSTTSVFNQASETTEVDTTNFFGLISTPAQISTATYQLERDEFTQEVRLFSTWDSKFNYHVGALYSKREQGYETRFPMIPGSTVFGFPNSDDGFIFWSSSTRLIEEKALFGQITYDFSKQWSATVGARTFKFNTELNDHFRGNLLFVAGGDSILEGESKISDEVYKFDLQFRPNDDLLLYATASEGFRAGGSNFPLPPSPSCMADLEDKIGTPTAPLGYDPDGLWNYEFGMKWTAAEGRVILNAAIFRMDWNDIQVGVSPLCGLNGTVMNAGKAKSEGFELELDAAITEHFTVGGGISYVDATFSDDVSFGGSFIFASAGTRVPDVAEWTGNIRADYTAPITDTITGFARVTLSYRGDRLAIPGIGNTDPKIKDAYEILNLRLGIGWNNWTLALFADNLTNSRPSFSGLPLTVAGSEIQAVTIDYSLRPTSYGLSVRYDFY